MSTRLNKYFLYQSIFTLLLTTNVFYGQNNSFIRGVDGSVLDEVEQSGGLYYKDGVQQDALEIFKENGVNLVRMKLWHSPQDQFNSLPRVMAIAQRVKALGLKFMLDFHYSDTWADPGKQYKPAAWEGLTFDVLTDSIYAYSKYVITQLKAQNTLPDFVQVGNEITCGMLWDDGKVCNPETSERWNKLGILLKSAINGVQDASTLSSAPKIILHIDRGGDNGGARWFFDAILAEGVEFDIIGLSYYPWWHGSLTDLKNNLNDLATRYNKDIIVVECAYPWTLDWGDSYNNIVGNSTDLLPAYPPTVEGQKNFLTDLIVIIQGTSDDRGVGYVYWSPEWIPGHPGSPWENLALFDFDGNALESMSALNTYAGIDEYIIYKPFILSNPYPNPANVYLIIPFSLRDENIVQASLHDILGKKIETIADKEFSSGKHTMKIDTGKYLPGTYLLYFTSNGFTDIRKIHIQ